MHGVADGPRWHSEQQARSRATRTAGGDLLRAPSPVGQTAARASIGGENASSNGLAWRHYYYHSPDPTTQKPLAPEASRASPPASVTLGTREAAALVAQHPLRSPSTSTAAASQERSHHTRTRKTRPSPPPPLPHHLASRRHARPATLALLSPPAPTHNTTHSRKTHSPSSRPAHRLQTLSAKSDPSRPANRRTGEPDLAMRREMRTLHQTRCEGRESVGEGVWPDKCHAGLLSLEPASLTPAASHVKLGPRLCINFTSVTGVAEPPLRSSLNCTTGRAWRSRLLHFACCTICLWGINTDSDTRP